MKKFLEKIDKILAGSTMVIVGSILGFIGWIYKPNDTIPIWILYIVVFFAYVSCVVIYVTSKKDVKTIYILPKVLETHNFKGNIVFVVEKNELLAQGHYVTIAYKEKGERFEQVVGLGYVETQCEEHMQVRVEKIYGENVDEIKSKMNNHKSIVIRPSVDSKLMQ